MKPHKCPVCEGSGKVKCSLYQKMRVPENDWSVTCRSCTGTGVLWEYEPGENYTLANVPYVFGETTNS